jgi:hypothetical protein
MRAILRLPILTFSPPNRLGAIKNPDNRDWQKKEGGAKWAQLSVFGKATILKVYERQSDEVTQ